MTELSLITAPNNQAEKAKSARWDDIDRGKGLAIVLVVLGHVVAREAPLGAEWYVLLKSTLYGFHMAFFMYLSGFVFAVSYREVNTWAAYGAYVRKRFMRLMPAYFVFALMVWLVKVVAANFMHVDNPATSLADFQKILLTPTTSVASFLWFIYVLFLICALVPLLLRVFRQDIRLALLAAVVLYFLPMPRLFNLDALVEFLPYFLLGCLAMQYRVEYFRILDRFWAIWVSLFVLALVVLDPARDKWLLGLVSIPALHALVRVSLIAKRNILVFLGTYSFSIYLMNTLCIGAAKGVVTKYVSWDGANFFWVAPVLFISGLMVPVLVKRLIFSRCQAVDRAT